MAVHLPLSAEAQAEARILMLSSNNILKPADGRPVTMPTQDMVLGLFFLTTDERAARRQGRGPRRSAPRPRRSWRSTPASSSLQAKVDIRFPVGTIPPRGWTPPVAEEGEPEWQQGDSFRLRTTLGRALFNELLPEDYPFVDYSVGKKQLSEIVNDLAERYPKVIVAATLDNLKAAGFYWATRSGVTVAISDIVVPEAKKEIVEGYEAQDEKVQKQYERGLITKDERTQELIAIWTKATNEVAEAMNANFPKTNPIFMMVDSGARGNMMQMRQIAGMRGLVSNAKNETIPRPIKASFREGLSVLEYFISTHGARKGLADTALRTADSGYLTRRLVDVSQDVIIREEDCGTERGLKLKIAAKGADGVLRKAEDVETSVYARMLAEDVVIDGKVHRRRPTSTSATCSSTQLVAHGVEEVKTRSVLTCESAVGTCAFCYGRSLATGKLVDIGEAVGIIAAQSIGEPGTQLTMRTFHTGGVAGDDITQGLPRVVELFEARTPKGVAPISEAAGRVRIEETEKTKKIVVTPDDGSDETAFPISKRARLLVGEGDHVEVGQKLTVGATNPHDVLRILGQRAVQVHLVGEVQKVYNSQGVSIHDKHIEIIIRQMLRRVTIIESGDAELLPGELVERSKFEGENRRVVAEGGHPASGRPQLMGITKASLATESWLSAASFQETTRVLTDAAINAKSDSLIGLKENVIIGKLIPAGTGLSRYRNIRVEPTEEAKAAMYSAVGYDDIDYSPFGTGSGQAVPLEDYDYGPYNQ